MEFDKAAGKAGPFGMTRRAWDEGGDGQRDSGQRVVWRRNGYWVVQDDDRHAQQAPLSDEDRAALDWYPLKGTEWPMTLDEALMPS